MSNELIKYDQPYDEYRAADALGSTDIIQLTKSLRHFYDYRNRKKNTKELTFGTLAHKMILEPDKVASEYAIYDGSKTKASKEYKEFVAYHDTKTVITQSVYELANQAYLSLQEHPVWQHFHNGFSELSVYDEIMGVKCKARLDYLTTNRQNIIDLKTIVDAEKWPQHCKQYGYHIQDYMYRSILAEALDMPFSEIKMYFVLIEKKDDSMYVKVKEMDEQSTMIAEHQVTAALEKYKDATSRNVDISKEFPYAQKVEKEGLPSYYINQCLREYGMENSYYE